MNEFRFLIKRKSKFDPYVPQEWLTYIGPDPCEDHSWSNSHQRYIKLEELPEFLSDYGPGIEGLQISAFDYTDSLERDLLDDQDRLLSKLKQINKTRAELGFRELKIS